MHWKQEARQAGLLEGRAEGELSGLEKGKAEGEAEGIYQVALTMKRKGIPVDQIAELTGLSIDDIEKPS